MSRPVPPPGQLTVGRVGKPFGVAGEVYVHPDPDLDEPFAPGTAYRTDRDGTLVVAQAREHGRRLLVHFEGVDDRTAAEALRGTVLLRDRGPVDDEDDDVVWVADLLGRDVVDEDGQLLGTVESVTDGAAHDFLVLARPDGGEVLVPLVDELVDLDADPIVLRPPPGLLDPDEAW